MTTKHFAVLFIALAILASVAGCGRVESYGEKISNRNITSIKDILAHPGNYDGKAVTLKGQIAIECETGCWFNFKEGDAIIYVNIEPSGFAIPQRGGSNAVVEGKVEMKDGKPILIAKGVEIR